MSRQLPLLTFIALMMLTSFRPPYPIDGFEESGIRRLKKLQLIIDGTIKETMPISGAQMSINDIVLHLLNEQVNDSASLPEVDPRLQKQIDGIFSSLNPNYSISILDITEGRPQRYASRKGERGYQPGSVGKIAVAAGFFTELSKVCPDSFEDGQELMRSRKVRAGRWAMTDSHTVPFYDTETNKSMKRTVQESDVFSLYEWLDHMLSVSNNGAASVCWRETVLMRAFGEDYPTLTEEEATAYFKETPKKMLSDLAIEVVNQPLRELGISSEEWRLGTFFTRGAGEFIPGQGGSIGTTSGLMKFMLAMEEGRVVDDKSSLEIKRLLYMTDRRIRYASSPSLIEAAVYFKSGSLYKCKEEAGYECGKYKGNVDNYMNSVAIVEHPDGTTYLVAMMSNVLKKNSGSDHQALAGRIDKVVRG